MSRSYKKFGSCPNTSKTPGMKAAFNRRVRRIPIDFIEGVSTIADGGAFKKLNETWDICDGKSMAKGFDPEYYDSLFEYRKLYYCK